MLIHDGVIPGTIGRTSKEANTLFGVRFVTTRADVGGLVQMLVELGDPVTKGQKAAIQRDAFGDVRREYTTTCSRKTREAASAARASRG